MGTEPIARYFDRKACCAVATGKPPRFAGTAPVLLSQLEGVGVAGRSVLELGSGTGGLSRSLARMGAARVHGVDLSPASVRRARELAEEEGLSERCTYEVGDASAVALDRHDVVVLDKVVCCFPDPDRLLANAVPAAGWAFAFAAPVSDGPTTVAVRSVVGMENLLRRLRGDPFRAFVHDLDRVRGPLREAGFERRAARNRLGWHVATHVRTAR